MPTLTILDTVGIQNYVFGSNRLKENVGASEIVKRATQAWIEKCLPSPHNVSGVTPTGQLILSSEQRIEDGTLKAEVIYAGGGNTVILFTLESEAKAFASDLSKHLLVEAPGVELALVHQTFEWDTDALGGEKRGVMFAAFAELADVKRRQPTNRPIAGLGVTAVCQSTGQPATTTDPTEPRRLISTEVRAKLTMAEEANKLLGQGPDGTSYTIPLDFDEMGRSRGESSYIAVVHADGNGMGRRLADIGKKHPAASQNRAYLDALRTFSEQVVQAAEASFKALSDKIVASIRGFGTKKETIMDKIPVENRILPYRPLVFGGDDLTFVCDGRLGLTLTAFYLKTFEAEARKAGLGNVYACAGMAVVKSHYPFARAYQLAVDLCNEAKK